MTIESIIIDTATDEAGKLPTQSQIARDDYSTQDIALLRLAYDTAMAKIAELQKAAVK